MGGRAACGTIGTLHGCARQPLVGGQPRHATPPLREAALAGGFADEAQFLVQGCQPVSILSTKCGRIGLVEEPGREHEGHLRMCGPAAGAFPLPERTRV